MRRQFRIHHMHQPHMECWNVAQQCFPVVHIWQIIVVSVSEKWMDKVNGQMQVRRAQQILCYELFLFNPTSFVRENLYPYQIRCIHCNNRGQHSENMDNITFNLYQSSGFVCLKHCTRHIVAMIVVSIHFEIWSSREDRLLSCQIGLRWPNDDYYPGGIDVWNISNGTSLHLIYIHVDTFAFSTIK